MTEAPDGYQRLYLWPNHVAHFVPGLASPNSTSASRCGLFPNGWGGYQYWAGTGSWDETQRLATMRNCRRCTRLVEADEAAIKRAREIIAQRAEEQ